jgi:hypothetical protein
VQNAGYFERCKPEEKYRNVAIGIQKIKVSLE